MWNVLVVNGMIQSLIFFVMKKLDYNIMMMSISSGLTVMEGHKEDRNMVHGEVYRFKYPAVIDDHYRYKGELSRVVPATDEKK